VKNSTDPINDSRNELESFIKHAHEQNMSDEMIRHLLLSSGWKDKEICNRLASVSLKLPIPKSREKGGAREAFFHLSAFTCLYVSAVGFIIMVFSLIDVTIPDATQEYWNDEWTYSKIRSALSTVVVFFPLYLVFNWLIQRDVRSGKAVAGGGVQRWLTYLTLFVIVMTILIDAAALLFWFLEGEMTIRLLLKAFVLFAVMCGAFAYVWWGATKWSTKPMAEAKVGLK
jgi:hypothetical protein